MPPHHRQSGNLKKQQKAQSKYWDRKQYEHYVPIVSALDRLRHHISAYTKKQRSDDKQKCFLEWLTIIGLFVAAIVAFASMRVAHIDTKKTIREASDSTKKTITAMNAQLSVMRSQIDEMRDEQRPWIKISNPVVPNNPMATDVRSGNVILPVRYKIVNIGTIPATNVISLYYDYTPMTFDAFMNMIKEPNIAQKSCLTARLPDADSAKSIGNTLFPNDPKDVETALTSKFPNVEEIHIGSAKEPLFTGGMLVLHVTYQSSRDATIHCTAESYYLRIKNPAVEATPRILIKGKWLGDIDKRNFGFNPAAIGGGYAD